MITKFKRTETPARSCSCRPRASPIKGSRSQFTLKFIPLISFLFIYPALSRSEENRSRRPRKQMKLKASRRSFSRKAKVGLSAVLFAWSLFMAGFYFSTLLFQVLAASSSRFGLRSVRFFSFIWILSAL